MNPYLSLTRLAVAATVILTISSCAPVAVVGTGGAGIVGMQERSVGSTVDDTVIWSEIKNLYIQKDVNDLLSSVSIEVNEGRVLLTGIVKKPETRVEAVKLAWQPKGVQEVINEIQVSDSKSIKTFAKDAWITTQVKSKLLLNKAVHSVNYSVDTVAGNVYIMGIAQNQKELDLVTNLTSTVSGVAHVISYVRIK